MHTVTLKSFPHRRHERVERVVQKHNGRLDHRARQHLLADVEAGRPQLVARYVEEHAAHNAAAELRLLGAEVELGDDAATKGAAA